MIPVDAVKTAGPRSPHAMTSESVVDKSIILQQNDRTSSVIH